MGWDTKKDQILRECYGKGKTASQIAKIIGNVTRNAVIGRASRLGLSSNIKVKNKDYINKKNYQNNDGNINIRSRKSKFRNVLLDKNFEEAKNLSLEELTEDTCKYLNGHPDEKDAKFCGRKNVDKFSYCPLHLMIVFQPKGKKEEVIDKDEDVPKFIRKKIKSA